jgi:hypothetical protein
MATDKHATIEGTVVLYGVCSEATTANATVGVSFVVCSRANTIRKNTETPIGASKNDSLEVNIKQTKSICCRLVTRMQRKIITQR